MGFDCGLGTFVNDAILKCDVDIRSDFYKNMVLCGGSTLAEGFTERFTKEMTSLVSGDGTVKVISPPERKYSAWIGMSILSSLSTFEDMWMTKEYYDEHGPTSVIEKCTVCFSANDQI